MFSMSVVPMSSGGGAQVISKELVSALSELGESHEIFLFKKKNEKRNFFMKWFLALRNLSNEVKLFKPRVVVSHLDGALFANALFVQTEKIHLVHFFHGPPTEARGFRGIIYEILKSFSLGKMDLLIFVSSAQELEHHKIYPAIKNKKSIVLRNPFIPSITPTPESDEVIIKNQKKCGRNILLLPGRLSNQKNQIFLIKLISKRKIDGSSDLLLFSGNGEDREYLISSARDYNLRVGFDFDQADTSDVIFLGHRNDVQDLMKKVDIVLLPSLYEGFPLALVEALCIGVTVISSDCSTGPAEIKNLISEKLNNNTTLLDNEFIIIPMNFNEIGLAAWCHAIDKITSKSKNKCRIISELSKNIFDRSMYCNRIRKEFEYNFSS